MRKTRRTLIVFAFVIGAIALQTTLFDRLRPLDAAPALGVLVVIALARHLAPEAALITGFGAGLFQDLLSDSVLGIWALSLSVVAFATIRLRDRLVEDITLIGPAVFGLSLAALALFAVLGTIFGQRTFADQALVRNMLLPAAYNLVLAIVVFPLTTWALAPERRTVGGWDL
ncbi:MAG: rod shape-determining protein MreD [Acidimicrobiia bacterium]|nr:rod shape-determining protein MreD [Acidimicrobiia bacterium]